MKKTIDTYKFLGYGNLYINEYDQLPRRIIRLQKLSQTIGIS